MPLGDALASVQEAVEARLFDAEEAPQARPATEALETAEAGGGVLAFVEADLSFLDREPIQVNISAPRNRLERIDVAAKKMGMTRSGFLVQAAEQLIEKTVDPASSRPRPDGAFPFPDPERVPGLTTRRLPRPGR